MDMHGCTFQRGKLMLLWMALVKKSLVRKCIASLHYWSSLALSGLQKPTSTGACVHCTMACGLAAFCQDWDSMLSYHSSSALSLAVWMTMLTDWERWDTCMIFFEQSVRKSGSLGNMVRLTTFVIRPIMQPYLHQDYQFFVDNYHTHHAH